MANLINTIPVYKPSLEKKVSVNTSQAVAKPQVKENQFSQFKVYDYIQAKPLSVAPTKPRNISEQKSKGYLVKENIFQSATSTVKSYLDYVKYFYNAAFKGEGKDYSIGKINDLTIRAGSLGIASVLATTKLFPFAKGMEFVGLGTWFASMALWPQIIGAPIKAKTGVDINQKYIDSYNRRKFVYEDNLYRPMDLYRYVDLSGKPLSKEEYYKKYNKDYVYLDKIGDKLGIPRNIPNRHEAIMAKMGQVAVQGKTLWMMTAGIMTPVLSSVIADSLQNPIKSGLEKYRYNQKSNELLKLDKKFDKLLDIEAEYSKRKVNINIDNVIKELGIDIPKVTLDKFEQIVGGKIHLTPKEYKEFEAFLTEQYAGTGFKDAIDNLVKRDLYCQETFVTLNDNLRDGLIETTKNAVKDAVSRMKKSFADTLPESIKNYSGMTQQEYWDIIKMSGNDGATEMNMLQHNSFENAANRILRAKFKKMNIDEDAVDMISDSISKNLKKYMESQHHHHIPKDKMLNLIKFMEMNKQLKAQIANFQNATIANIAESITANNWQKVPQKYLEALGFTKAELTALATNGANASKVVSAKLDSIVSNPKQYEQVLKTMSKYAQEAIAKEQKALIQLIGTADTPGTLSKFKDLVVSISGANFGEKLQNPLDAYFRATIVDVQNKLRNTIDSFVRPIKALDTFKYIEESVLNILGNNENEYKNLLKTYPYYYPFENLDYETAKKSLTQYIKDIVVDKNDINNWTTKFEHNLPGSKKGMKWSLEMVKKIADIVNGRISKDTSTLVGEKMSKICNINNEIMKYRYLNLEYKLAKKFPYEDCFMRVYRPAEKFAEELINEICKSEFDNFYILEGLIDERKGELSLNQIDALKKIRDNAKRKIIDKDYFKNTISQYLNFNASSKEVAEMSGKNVTDFFVDAAQNVRSRNKWMKVAYGLLAGTTVLSAIVISMMGKENRFNKNMYKKKEKELVNND